MREITFTIPGNPPLTIHAIEQADGSILFELSVDGDDLADIRGLFFNLADPSLVDNLVVTGADLTDQAYGDVSGFRNGNNLKGGGRSPYDVGLNFGTPGIGTDDINSTSFVLSSINGDALTLDLIAQIEFGARMTSTGPANSNRNGSQKITTIAPAAPDAIDDDAETLEDTPVTVDVVANDTDADGDALTVIEVGAASNGTIEIVSNQILYTPIEHWSGVDSFTYRIFDGDGGFDVATTTITVVAVADAPNLELSVRAGNSVNEVIVDITSSLVDADGSETYILSFSNLPAGAIIQGASGGQILMPTGSDSITLVLDEDADFDFDFTVNATSTEASNGDMATSTETIDVIYEFNENTNIVNFDALDQSMWTPGEEFVFVDNRFLGIEISDSGSNGGLITTSWSYDVKAGFQSDLRFEGGNIDATIPWQIDIDTGFNLTTDVLTLDTSAVLLGGGSFLTDGPSLEYMLDFIFNYSLNADVDIVVNLPSPFPDINQGLFNISPAANNTINIVDYDSDTAGGLAFDFPFGITATLAWPNLEVTGTETATPGTYSGNGASNNALNINLDIDQALADIFLGGVNPFDLSVSAGVAGATLELVDVDVSAGLNFLQEFMLQAGTLEATLVFENGSEFDFTFGDELVFNFASTLDVDNDGDIEFEVVMDLVDSMYANDTNLGFNVGWNFDLVKGTWFYGIDLGILGSIGDNGTYGPLVDLGQNMIPVADIDIFDAQFELDFAPETIDLFA